MSWKNDVYAQVYEEMEKTHRRSSNEMTDSIPF